MTRALLISETSSVRFPSAPSRLTPLGSLLPSSPLLRVSTRSAISTAFPSWGTRCKTPGATTPTSSATAAPTARTSAAAGSSIWCWERRDRGLARPFGATNPFQLARPASRLALLPGFGFRAGPRWGITKPPPFIHLSTAGKPPMSDRKFAHLHLHTHYSLLDGFNRIP